MKTLSFPDLSIGRAKGRPLFQVSGQVRLEAGVHLLSAPNGAGKSTFLQTMAGVIAPLAGWVKWGEGALQSREEVFYLSEYLHIPRWIRLEEWVSFHADSSRSSPDGRKEDWEALGLRGLEKSFLGRTSQGERRKTNWIAADVSNRPVLLLDEPLDGLDLWAMEGARAILRRWKEEGRVILLVAHQLSEVFDLAESVLAVRDGKLDQVRFGTGARPGDARAIREWILSFYQKT